MASTQIPLPEKTWVQITTTDKTGSIRHQAGNTTIVFTESPTQPAALNPNTPVMEATIKDQDFTYFNVAAADFVWAWANSGDAILTVSPGSA